MADVPYDPKNKAETLKYWEDAMPHLGVSEDAEFRRLAHERYREVLESGMTIPWSEVRDYLRRRVKDPNATRPKARKWSQKP